MWINSLKQKKIFSIILIKIIFNLLKILLKKLTFVVISHMLRLHLIALFAAKKITVQFLVNQNFVLLAVNSMLKNGV